jgi:hypothetical protein
MEIFFCIFRDQPLPLELEKIRTVILNHSSSLAILQSSLSKANLQNKVANGQDNICFTEDSESAKRPLTSESLIETDGTNKREDIVQIGANKKEGIVEIGANKKEDIVEIHTENNSNRNFIQKDSAVKVKQNLDANSPTDEVKKFQL